MNNYWFEHWKNGSLVNIEMCQAKSVKEAVCLLSDQFKGCFKLVDKQTEIQRVKENWRQFEAISGD